MKLVDSHHLHCMNYVSMERVVMATLATGGEILKATHSIAWLEILRSIPHPAADTHWVDQLEAHLQHPASWQDCIAASAQYLQRIIARFDGRWFTGHDLPEANSVALECLEFIVAEGCLRWSAQIADDLVHGRTVDRELLVQSVEHLHEEHSLGSVTGPLVHAARRLQIPTRRLDGGSLIQLGHGMFQRRLRRSCTDSTSYIAEIVSSHKVLVKTVWKELGLPIAEGWIVSSVEDAVEALSVLNSPVVIKPGDSDYGRGVTVNIQSTSQIAAAFKKAAAEGGSVMIEKFMPGSSYRLLVLRGKVISAVRRDPASVRGDGIHTISELIELENNSGRRGNDRRWPLYKLDRDRVDLDYLAEAGLDLASIPETGRLVRLQLDISHTDGGSTHEVLDHVHPETLKVAEIAADCIGLDLAGIDLIASDIGQPLSLQGGGLLEINAEPGIGLHLPPMCDRPRLIDEAIIKSLFTFGRPQRVPIILILTESCSPGNVQSWLEEYGSSEGWQAVSTVDETVVDGMRLNPKSSHLCDRLQAALLHPRTSLVIAVASLRDVLSHGVGVDYLDTVVMTDTLQNLEQSCETPQTANRMLNQLAHNSNRVIVPEKLTHLVR